MDFDTLKSINDSIKRANGKLILENETLKKENEALKLELNSLAKNFHKLSVKVQDLMLKNDALFDKKEAQKKENKELLKSNRYLKSIIETLQKEHSGRPLKSSSRGNYPSGKPSPPKKGKYYIPLKTRLKEHTGERNGKKILNPVYDRLSSIMSLFFENAEVSCNTIKENFGISRATFARDMKTLKELRFVELKNSKKEGLYVLTREGKKFKKEIKKESKKTSF